MLNQNINRSLKELEQMQNRNYNSKAGSVISPFSHLSNGRSRIYSGFKDTSTFDINSTTFDQKSSRHNSFDTGEEQVFSNSLNTKETSNPTVQNLKSIPPTSRRLFADRFAQSISNANSKKNFVYTNRNVVKNVLQSTAAPSNLNHKQIQKLRILKRITNDMQPQ